MGKAAHKVSSKLKNVKHHFLPKKGNLYGVIPYIEDGFKMLKVGDLFFATNMKVWFWRMEQEVGFWVCSRFLFYEIDVGAFMFCFV